MNYKRICTVLGAILILSCLVISINNTKENIIHKKQIEDRIQLSEDEKRSFKYKQLIEDIKSVEDGKGLKYAKQGSSETQINEGVITIVMYSTEYNGDGYIVRLSSVTDVTMYEFIRDEKCVYSAYINHRYGSGNFDQKRARHVKMLIVYIFLGIIAILEIVFFCIYKRKNGKNKNIEVKKTV